MPACILSQPITTPQFARDLFLTANIPENAKRSLAINVLNTISELKMQDSTSSSDAFVAKTNVLQNQSAKL
jgi:hypothetical protein